MRRTIIATLRQSTCVRAPHLNFMSYDIERIQTTLCNKSLLFTCTMFKGNGGDHLQLHTIRHLQQSKSLLRQQIPTTN